MLLSHGQARVNMVSEQLNTPAGGQVQDDTRKWSADARLALVPATNSGRVTEIGAGRLADMISLAMSRPEGERSRLVIQTEPVSRKIGWPEIAALAARVDCPIII